MKPECEMLKRFLTDPTCKSDECVSTDIDVISETLSEKYGFEITSKMIKGCIKHWDKLRDKLYIDMKKHGLLSGNPKEDWDIVTSDFLDKYGIIPLSFKKNRGITGTYITASYEEQEEIKTSNVVHTLKGLGTQLKYMHLIGAKFQITGKTPYELLGDAKEMETKVLNGKVIKIVDEEDVSKEEISKEQPNEKTLKEISFLKEKISKLEAEGRNHNVKVLNRLEERLKMITPKIDEFEQNFQTELKTPRIFDRKTTEKIERVDKKWGDLDTWIKRNQTPEEPIEKWGEAVYEESKAAKTKSTTFELDDQNPKEDEIQKDESIVEVEKKVEEITKEENVEEIKSKEQLIEKKKEEPTIETKPKKRIIRRKVINEK